MTTTRTTAAMATAAATAATATATTKGGPRQRHHRLDRLAEPLRVAPPAPASRKRGAARTSTVTGRDFFG